MQCTLAQMHTYLGLDDTCSLPMKKEKEIPSIGLPSQMQNCDQLKIYACKLYSIAKTKQGIELISVNWAFATNQDHFIWIEWEMLTQNTQIYKSYMHVYRVSANNWQWDFNGFWHMLKKSTNKQCTVHMVVWITTPNLYCAQIVCTFVCTAPQWLW